jgi:AcrR family transcriptional regulator
LLLSKNLQINFSDPKQDRSKKTLDDLLQAAFEIVEAADTAKFTSRTLASKAGYSLGTLSQRLGSVEDVFFWAIQKGRETKLNAYINTMEQFDTQLPIQVFLEKFVDIAFDNMNIVTTKVMRFYDHRLTLKYGLSADYFNYIDVLIEPYLELSQKNETNTFRVLSLEEARFIFQCGLALLERPFANEDPIAGTEQHRKIAVDNLIRLLAK